MRKRCGGLLNEAGENLNEVGDASSTATHARGRSDQWSLFGSDSDESNSVGGGGGRALSSDDSYDEFDSSEEEQPQQRRRLRQKRRKKAGP